MKIAVLFDGAGLARLGLEQAGHICTGYELDSNKHYLSKMVGSGSCILADATKVELTNFNAVWASPPCQWLSSARTQGKPVSDFAINYLDWCLKLSHSILWVENIVQLRTEANFWGKMYNAGQFSNLQNRNRIIGGRYRIPNLLKPYKKTYPNLCPCITATEYKGCANDRRRASRWYGRRLTLEECAYHQGFIMPRKWLLPPKDWFDSDIKWEHQLYEAIGNGVPVYMSQKFGEEYS